jgi:ribosomal protein S18 acetylase RimI-like enzyme
MNSYNSYRKLATLKNGERVLIRFLNGEDRESLIKLFQNALNGDIEFCKEDLKNPQVVDHWLAPENSNRILGLVAVDLKTNLPVATLLLYRGQQAALKVGEIQNIFVSRAFQGCGLGSLLLDELLDLSVRENIHWLKAEVPLEQNYAVKAFLARDFEIRATFEDFFISQKGIPYDVALMMRPLIKKEANDF